jgi:dihydroorotase
MTALIFGGKIVNEGRVFDGSIIIENDRISEIKEGTETPRGIYDNVVDATGCFVLPGVIDEHVHFREPGLTAKADIESESRAAAYGGVTSYFEMPNTIPQTTTLEALAEKRKLASAKSHVNYSFFFGATNNNSDAFASLDIHRVPGIKLFMGSSTGNMLVDKFGSLLKIFETAANLDLPLMTHCEDTDIINKNMAQVKKSYGDDPEVFLHPLIRSAEACYESTALAVALAKTYGTRLHVAHVSTAQELEFFGEFNNITAEAVIAHLFFTNRDYLTSGSLIKCNPAVKTPADRDELRAALTDGRISAIGTDHAPHQLSEKQGGCCHAASGMPMVQFSLPTMLELVDEGVLSIERMVELMCHNPARLFSVRERGFLRPDYKADITIVRPHTPWTVDEELIQSKCKWSPMTGHTFQWQICHTVCNGHFIYSNGRFDDLSRGEEILFR